MNKSSFGKKWGHEQSPLQKERKKLSEISKKDLTLNQKIRLNKLDILYISDYIKVIKQDRSIIEHFLKYIESKKKENQKLTNLIKKEKEILKRKQIRKKTIPKFLVNKKRK